MFRDRLEPITPKPIKPISARALLIKRLDYFVMNIKKKNSTYETKAIPIRAFIFLIFNAFNII